MDSCSSKQERVAWLVLEAYTRSYTQERQRLSFHPSRVVNCIETKASVPLIPFWGRAGLGTILMSHAPLAGPGHPQPKQHRTGPLSLPLGTLGTRPTNRPF